MPLPSNTEQKLRTLYQVLADAALEPGHPYYHPEVNGREASAIHEIVTEVSWQEGNGVCCFTGQRGTGKSTELKRLQSLLEQQGMEAFYIDFSEYILLSKPIEITDFLISLAGALSEAIEKKYDASPGNRGYWQRFLDFLHRDIQMDPVGIKVTIPAITSVDIKASLKNDPTFKERIQISTRGHVARLVAEAHGFMQDAVDFIRSRRGDPNLKVVLLVDSVERIRGVGDEEMGVFESVRNLFFTHADHLCIPKLHVVYTVPPYLSVLAAGAGALMGGVVTRRLVSTHIFKDRSREPDERGISVLRTVVEKRFPEWREIFFQEALDRLAQKSGGDLREFFRLIRYCLPKVRNVSHLPLNIAAVEPVLDLVRQEMLPIPSDRLDWLKRISSTHDTCLASEADLPVLAGFLDNRLVLNYRNGTDWYDVHPLLREVVDHHGAAN